jgi:hypothetical protein
MATPKEPAGTGFGNRGDKYDEDYSNTCFVFSLCHGSIRTIGWRFPWQRKHEQFDSDD